MDIEHPIDVQRGCLIKTKNSFGEPINIRYYFIITGTRINNGEVDALYIKFDKPNFYAFRSLDGNGTGEITRRKNGKWMFRGHNRLYANEYVNFYT